MALVYDLTPSEVEVTIGDKQYTLREASGAAVCKYQNRVLKYTQFSTTGSNTLMEGIADIGPFFVSLCLFDEKNNPVSENVIRSWPSRIQESLFKEAKTLAGLEKGQEPEEKQLGE